MGKGSGPSPLEPRFNADGGFDGLFAAKRVPMVRLATLLVGSAAIAEEVVQDAFAAVSERWNTVDRPGAYLRTSVVNGCAGILRRRTIEQRYRAGLDHTCGLRPEGTVVCWGGNDSGKAAPPAGRFVAVVAGTNHSCGIRNDKTIVCWGADRDGGLDAPSGQFSEISTSSAGGGHTCALRTDGTAVCWGWNPSGQTNAPSGRFAASRQPQLVLEPDPPDPPLTVEPARGSEGLVSVGGHHSCGLTPGGEIVCWGANESGQTSVPNERFSAVAAGGFHTCGLRPDGVVVCWRWEEDGETDPPGERFDAISAGMSHSCGLRTDGAAVCWGTNQFRELNVPDGRFTGLTVGWHHACGLRTDSTVACWGWNSGGQTDAPSGRFGP